MRHAEVTCGSLTISEQKGYNAVVGEPLRACHLPPREPNPNLPHGFSFDDLAVISRRVARTALGLIIDRDEARDIAAVGVIERLYSGPPPSRSDLYRAAQRAVSAANDREYSYCGLDKNVSRSGRLGTPPEFARFWGGRAALVAPFEEALVERIAARQVWAALPARHREVLWALAVYGTYAGAGSALGLSAKGFQNRIYKARLSARELWFWPDEPAGQWAPDRPGGVNRRGLNRGLGHLARRRWDAARRPA